jgi:plasmid stabilization system protein ParE
MGFRLLPEAEAELDGIWLYVARESGSSDIANRLIEGITGRFWLLAQHPQIGRRRDVDLRPGLRSFLLESTSFSIPSRTKMCSFSM